jgi:hypothetical protein
VDVGRFADTLCESAVCVEMSDRDKPEAVRSLHIREWGILLSSRRHFMNLLLLAQGADGAEGVFVGFGILWILMLVLGIAALGVWLWALVDAIRNPALDGTMRIVWVLVIIFTQIIGAIIYLAVGRSSKTPRSA